MIDIYEEWRSYENNRVLLRPVELEDAEQLLGTYSDPKSRLLFNVDNFPKPCYFDSLEQMEEEIQFYLFSYREKYFVRWSVVDKGTGAVVGTIENFNRQAFLEDHSPRDAFHHVGLLRIDLASAYEDTIFLRELIDLILETGFHDFQCETIATKIPPEGQLREKVFTEAGFVAVSDTILGNNGSGLGNYYVVGKKEGFHVI